VIFGEILYLKVSVFRRWSKMEKGYKPSGYNSLSPYFVVVGAQKMVDLLTELFDAKVLRNCDTPEGSLKHVEVLIDIQ